jgi:hypothetical protein
MDSNLGRYANGADKQRCLFLDNDVYQLCKVAAGVIVLDIAPE